jgi:dissimilatory sulfite reductase (desulfoviridin) alpha/beta subunit
VNVAQEIQKFRNRTNQEIKYTEIHKSRNCYDSIGFCEVSTDPDHYTVLRCQKMMQCALALLMNTNFMKR